MGKRNFLVEGVSGTGKTTVCDELVRRGHQAIHGDRQLAYQGDPVTGEVSVVGGHAHHVWDVAAVRALAADRTEEATFFCGGSRNVTRFLEVFDAVFVLQVDGATLHRRLDARPDSEWEGDPVARELVTRLHETGEDLPDGIAVDATAPVAEVVDEILRLAGPGRQNHSHTVPGGRGFWFTGELWAASAGLPVTQVLLEDVGELDRDCWFRGRAPSIREVAEHARRIADADLAFPVILSAAGILMDGGHRVARAWIEGRTAIDAVRFEVDPEPAWVTRDATS